MTKVFIAGSRQITRLPAEVKIRIDTTIDKRSKAVRPAWPRRPIHTSSFTVCSKTTCGSSSSQVLYGRGGKPIAEQLGRTLLAVELADAIRAYSGREPP